MGMKELHADLVRMIAQSNKLYTAIMPKDSTTITHIGI